MQKWCPEPFAVPGAAGETPVGPVFRGMTGKEPPAAAGDPDADIPQFRRETGYTDSRSLLATLTRQERTDLYDLAELDVAGSYEACAAEQAAEYAARLEEARREAAASLAEWTAGLDEAVREDLSRAAAGAARLAVRIAEKIIRDTVKVDHGVLTRAFETILFKQQAAAPLHVFVSPADALWLGSQAELRTRLNIEVVGEDRRLTDGDCRVRSGGREWDLTIASQLETLGEIIDEEIATGSARGTADGNRGADEPRLD
jgi:flagellar biosynthesis/type III secretory pathway protein FliH